jgi:hypothetical protein
MWDFSGGSFSSRARPLLFLADRGDSESSHFSSSLLDAPSMLDGSFWERLVESVGGVQPLSLLEWSLLCSTVGFRSKGQEDKTMAFLSTLGEEHIWEDKLVG